MQTWMFNPPSDRKALSALRDRGLDTIVATNGSQPVALEMGLTVYSMIHTFPLTESTELAEDVYGNRIEWFRSSCPNAPESRRRFYMELADLLRVGVQGVFLDGVRFSSPASSSVPSSVFTCFCPRCTGDMAWKGYDVHRIQHDVKRVSDLFLCGSLSEAAAFLKAMYSPSGCFSLARALPGVAQWMRYKNQVIAEFVAEVRNWMKDHYPTRVLGAFLFQPDLAYFVGQDYVGLGPNLDLVSPMIYRNYPSSPGPAAVNQELVTVAEFLHQGTGLDRQSTLKDLAKILGISVDQPPRDGLGEATLSVSIESAVADAVAATAMVGGEKVAPIIWAGDPQLSATIDALAGAGLDHCILFTYDTGYAAHGEGFLNRCLR